MLYLFWWLIKFLTLLQTHIPPTAYGHHKPSPPSYLTCPKWVFWFIPTKIFPQVFLISTNGTTINPAAQAKSIGLVVDAFLPQTSKCIPFSKPYQYTSKQQLKSFHFSPAPLESSCFKSLFCNILCFHFDPAIHCTCTQNTILLESDPVMFLKHCNGFSLLIE